MTTQNHKLYENKDDENIASYAGTVRTERKSILFKIQ